MARRHNGMLGRPTGRDIVHRWEGVVIFYVRFSIDKEF